jgi:hypothetical protein
MDRRWTLLAALGGALLARALVAHRRRVAADRAWSDAADADEAITAASVESFPASDPPSNTVTTGSTL